MCIKIGIGQDSHRFQIAGHKKKCVVAGVIFSDVPGLDANSDGDVVLHATCNAISSVTHAPILGEIAPKLCKEQGIQDSAVFLIKALETLKDIKISHISFSIEGSRPRFNHRAIEMRKNLAKLLKINMEQIGMTFTTGDGLTAFGKGEGLQCFCIATFYDPSHS
jgi:2-C-methyl-D-erythritol 2,4-cyclodiphosphate synthase